MKKIQKKVVRLFEELDKRKYTLASGESCTGGLLGGEITSVPGSSTYYCGGVVAYANRVKNSLLGVSERLLDKRGAVSAPVAEAMARGAREELGTEVGLATTGIAGPSGGSEEKPVGLVYISVCSPAGSEFSKNIFEGNRAEVRRKTIRSTLELGIKHLRD